MFRVALPWIFAISSLLAYSLWGFTNGLIAEKFEPFSGLFYSSIGYLFAGLVSLTFIGFHPKVTLSGICSGLLLGVATGFGGLFLLLAIYKLENTSLLVALTAIYPVGTIILCHFFARDHLTLKEIIGCIVSVAGILIMLL